MPDITGPVHLIYNPSSFKIQKIAGVLGKVFEMGGWRAEAQLLARVKHLEEMAKTALKRQTLLESRKILKDGVRCRFLVLSSPTVSLPQ